MNVLWLVLLAFPPVLTHNGGSGGGGVTLNFGPWVLRAGGGGGGIDGNGDGGGGFFLGTSAPPKAGENPPPFIEVNAGGGGGQPGNGGGFGGVSIGNFIRVLGYGARGKRNAVQKRQAAAETTTAAAAGIGSISLSGVTGGDSGSGGVLGGFNISSVLGGLGLGGTPTDSRFKAPGPSEEDALQFNYADRPTYDSKGNAITPMNSRFLIVKGKYSVPDTK